MKSRMRPPSLFLLTAWLGMLMITAAGCSPGQVTPPSLLTPTMECDQELVLPQITEIQPAQPGPGEEITVIGSGGYLQDTCGGFSEGSRDFTLYLDQEPAGSLSCYVNRCEGKLVLPAALSTGKHCLSVEPDRCTFEFQASSE